MEDFFLVLLHCRNAQTKLARRLAALRTGAEKRLGLAPQGPVLNFFVFCEKKLLLRRVVEKAERGTVGFREAQLVRVQLELLDRRRRNRRLRTADWGLGLCVLKLRVRLRWRLSLGP